MIVVIIIHTLKCIEVHTSATSNQPHKTSAQVHLNSEFLNLLFDLYYT